MPLQAILSHARSSPERPAIVHNGETWSYAAFAQAIADARARLAGAGIPPGGLVVIATDHLLEGWFAGFALRSLGFTTIAVDRHMDLPALGLRGVSGVVLVEGSPFEAAESFARDGGLAIARVAAASLPVPAKGALPDLPAAAGTGMGGHVRLTSGTTGTYKKVLRDPRSEDEVVRSLVSLHGLAPSSLVFAGNFPAWTAGGYAWPRAAWSVGATVVFENSPQPWLPLGRLAPTHAFATPATLATWLQAPEDAFRRNDALALMVTAGALPKALADGARARITRELYVAYASTEATMVTMTRIEGDEDLVWHRPLDPRSIAIVDEAGHELPVGEVGLVRVRASPGVDGYLDDEAATREFFRDGGFYPGDLGMLRADGRLSLHGRATDVINLLGSKVATGPIEREFQDGLGVPGVCVFSLPDGPGEEVHVAIESRVPVARDKLAALARQALAGFPQVHFHVLEELPRNAMGKVRRIELRRRFARG